MLPSWHCFRNPDALDPRLRLVRNVQFWLRKTRTAVARHRSEIWLWILLDKYRGGLQLLLATGVWDVLCHILWVLSREDVMRECDIHHTRAIKTNNAVNLSRKPGLDLCCDLLQHLQGVPRTCSFYIIIRTSILLVPSSLKLSFIWNVTIYNSRIIWMACFGQFCSILFNM